MDSNNLNDQHITLQILLETISSLRQCIDDEYPTRAETDEKLDALYENLLGEITELSEVLVSQLTYVSNSLGFILMVLATEGMITEDEMNMLQKRDFDFAELLTKYLCRKTEGELDEEVIRATLAESIDEAEKRAEDDGTTTINDPKTYKE